MHTRNEITQFVKARFGDQIDLGACLVGKNLNLMSFRGFGRLDKLALISGPDVYDMVTNPTGTQRMLNREHAKECFEYAADSVDKPAKVEPRAFPEVLLNARDRNVLEFYSIEDPDELLDLDSFTQQAEVSHIIVGLRLILSQIKFPKADKSPQISRVDGNHRLHGADLELERAASNVVSQDEEDEDGELAFPVVPFCLLVGLTPLQEGSLFRDINAEHKGMETAHLDTLTVRLHTPDEMKNDPELFPLWMADELTRPGRSFQGMVFLGGSTRGVKANQMLVPIKINALKTLVGVQLRAATMVSTLLREQPDELLNLVDRYWNAVKRSFPEAWTNKRDFILLQSIGLNGFAEFGGKLLDRAFDEESVDEEDFMRYLAPVVNSMSLRRGDYKGVAGAGGAREIASRLIVASSPDAVKSERILSKLRKPISTDQKLGLARD
jgi:hypothetical protein